MARGKMDMGEEIKLKKPLRQSNYELLRIISMIIIVAHHYAKHGGFATESLSRSALAIRGVTEKCEIKGKYSTGKFTETQIAEFPEYTNSIIKRIE